MAHAVSKSTKSREHILKAKEIPDMVFRLSCRLDTIGINRMKYQEKHTNFFQEKEGGSG